MIDTIKGYKDITDLEFNQISHLVERAEGLSNGSFIHYKVKLSNFTIKIVLNLNNKPLRLRFEGSLAKFYFGHNLSTLDPYTCKRAIEMLSDNLQVNISEATLTRIDFGANLCLEFPVANYISSLISYRNYPVYNHYTSKTFTSLSNSKTLCFYDKIKELKKDKKLFSQIPTEYQKQNILRYEMRLQKKLAYSLGMKIVTLNNLTMGNFHKHLAKLWFHSYKKVDKLSFSEDPIHLIHTRNGFLRYLSYHGLQKLSYEKVLSIIHNLVFTVKNPGVKRSKMKSLIRELVGQAKKDSLAHNLVKELDIKIHQSIKLL